jgi:hypothetical protein
MLGGPEQTWADPPGFDLVMASTSPRMATSPAGVTRATVAFCGDHSSRWAGKSRQKVQRFATMPTR